MREKYLRYITEIGLRYAVHYAKYEGITLAVVQLWSSSAIAEGASGFPVDTANTASTDNTGNHTGNHTYTMNQIRRYYNEAITR